MEENCKEQPLIMRLSKITYHIGFKNGAHKFEQQQQQQLEHTAKLQAAAGGKVWFDFKGIICVIEGNNFRKFIQL